MKFNNIGIVYLESVDDYDVGLIQSIFCVIGIFGLCFAYK